MAPDSPNSWPLRSLFELAEYQNGQAFRPAETRGAGLPIIKIAELNEGIGPSTGRAARWIDPRKVIHAGDLLFAWSGSVGVYKWNGPEAVLNQHIFKVTSREGVDQTFLRYLLERQLPTFQRVVDDQATTMGHVKVSDLKRLRINLPPIPEQRAIAHVLGSLDDKIELNRRMNQTLEEICRALFKFWFVDFGPVRAKMEGRWKRGESLPGMPAEMWDLWPSEFEESEIGEIPKGWKVNTVGEVAEFLYGEPLKEQDRNGGEVPVFGSNGIIGWHDKRLVDGPGIVVGRKGSPGTVTWASGDFWPIDTTFYVVRSKESPPMDYLFYALAQLDLPSLEADSAVPGLNRRAAIGSRIVVPQPEITSRFEMTVTPLRSRVAKCLAESGTLSSYRDALLPKLLSGEVRVKVDS